MDGVEGFASPDTAQMSEWSYLGNDDGESSSEVTLYHSNLEIHSRLHHVRSGFSCSFRDPTSEIVPKKRTCSRPTIDKAWQRTSFTSSALLSSPSPSSVPLIVIRVLYSHLPHYFPGSPCISNGHAIACDISQWASRHFLHVLDSLQWASSKTLASDLLFSIAKAPRHRIA